MVRVPRSGADGPQLALMAPSLRVSAAAPEASDELRAEVKKREAGKEKQKGRQEEGGAGQDRKEEGSEKGDRRKERGRRRRKEKIVERQGKKRK